MLNKLSKKISRPVYWATIAVIVLLSAGVFTPAALSMRNSYISYAQKNMQLAAGNMEYSFNAVFSGISQLTSDNGIITELGNESPVLSERAKNYMEALRLSQKVLGVYIYKYDKDTLNGALIDYSKNISFPVSFEQIINNAAVNAFLSGDAGSHISVRHTDISGSFAQSKYPSEKGIITCMQKIYGASGEPAGFAAADISPDILYDFFNNNAPDYAGSKTYLIADTGVVLHNNDYQSSDMTAVNNAKGKSSGYLIYKHYYVFGASFFTSDAVMVHMANNRAFARMFWISFAILILADIISGTAAYYISGFIAGRVTKPINAIQNKMRSDEVTNE